MRRELVSKRRYEHVCNFCGKDENQVQAMVAGPDVDICDECVALAAEIVNRKMAELKGAT